MLNVIKQIEVVGEHINSPTTSQVGTSGYLASGTKKTKQLTTKGATTITPSTSAQTAVASGVYTTGTVTVSAVPTETKSVIPSSEVQTITPSSGKFLSKVTVNAADMSSVDINNGAIQNCYSYDSDINTGTFVEFIGNEVKYTTVSTCIQSDINVLDMYDLAKINDNTLLLAYYDNDTTYLNFKLLKINDINNITSSSELATTITPYKNNFNSLKIIVMSETSAVLLYNNKGSQAACIAISITNDTITIGTPYLMEKANNYQSIYSYAGIRLSNNTLLLGYGNDSSMKLYGAILTVNSTTISLLYSTKLLNNSYTGYLDMKITHISGNYYLISAKDNNESLNITTILVNSDNTLTVTSGSIYGGTYVSSDVTYYDILKIEDNKILISYSYSSTLRYVVASISSGSITLGTALTVLSGTNYAPYGAKIMKIGIDQIVGFKPGYNGNSLLLTLITINGTTITTESTDYIFNNDHTGSTSDYDRYIYLSPSCFLYSYIFGDNSAVEGIGLSLTRTTGDKVQASTNFIDGITTSKITTSTSGNIKKLN